MSDISSENKTIAKTIVSVFGGQPEVTCFWDENEKNYIDILMCEGQPQNGVTSYSTIGLSDFPLITKDYDSGIRLEIVGACADSCKNFGNILSTAAFCIINSKWFCSPGIIFPDIVSMYSCSSTMKHLLFTSPFLWGDRFQTLELDSKIVAWLLAIPISEEEYCYAESEGTEMLISFQYFPVSASIM